jgi:hypothetical protein
MICEFKTGNPARGNPFSQKIWNPWYRINSVKHFPDMSQPEGFSNISLFQGIGSSSGSKWIHNGQAGSKR